MSLTNFALAVPHATGAPGSGNRNSIDMTHNMLQWHAYLVRYTSLALAPRA